jgi:hypothetical protein
VRTRRFLLALLVAALPAGMAASFPARAQTNDSPAGQGEATAYKPPLRGAPGGRVGGASRSASVPRVPLPVIELLAPADHTGVTARADPTLYFLVSRPAPWPLQFTISAPMQPAPVVDVTIPSPTAAGLQAISTGSYRVRLQPGVVYTWSVSVVLDRRAWSRNIVASATILYDPAGASTAASAAALAGSGQWYDAIAAAMEEHAQGRPGPLAALMRQAGVGSGAGESGIARTQ